MDERMTTEELAKECEGIAYSEFPQTTRMYKTLAAAARRLTLLAKVVEASHEYDESVRIGGVRVRTCSECDGINPNHFGLIPGLPDEPRGHTPPCERGRIFSALASDLPTPTTEER